MMKKGMLFLLCAAGFCCLAENVVVRRDFDVPAGWKYPVIQGRDFWFLLPQSLSNNRVYKLVDMPAVASSSFSGEKKAGPDVLKIERPASLFSCLFSRYSKMLFVP